jgi:hypothetical protein
MLVFKKKIGHVIKLVIQSEKNGYLKHCVKLLNELMTKKVKGKNIMSWMGGESESIKGNTLFSSL